MTQYLNIRKWDMLLCAVMIFALTITVYAGFDATDLWREKILFLVIGTAVETVAWFLVFYSKRTIPIGAAVVVIVLIVMTVMARSGGVNPFADEAENAYFKFFLLTAVAFGVVILSRFRGGSIVLFAGGVFLIALIQFMYENSMVFSLLLFLCAAGVMIAYRNYMTNVLNSATVQVAPGRSVFMSFLMIVCVMAVAGGVFFAIVKPLDPPKQDVKILTKYMSLEILEKIGVANVTTIHDLEQNASNEQKEDMTVDKSNNQDTEGQDDGKAKNKNQTERQEWIKYHRDILIGVVPVLIAALIVAVILIRLYLRKRKYQKMLALDIEQRIPAFYQYFLNCFRHVGVNRHPEETPYEFSGRAAPLVRDFETGGVGLRELTETLVAAKYGLREITHEELAAYDSFYKAIFKNCRKRLGNFKYAFHFFTI